MIHRILTYIADQGLSSLGLKQVPTSWHYLMNSGGAKVNGRITFLLFANGDQQPCLVARFYRDPAWNTRLLEEYETQTVIYRSSTPSLRASLPHPLALVDLGQRTVMFEQPLNGVPLSRELSGNRLNKATIGKHLVEAAQWIARFHQQAAQPVSHVTWRAALESCLTRYASECAPLSPAEEDALQAIRWATLVVDQDLPYTWSHGDFCHKNILRSPGGNLQLLDWQYVQLGSFFGFDLAHFPLLYLQWVFHKLPQGEHWFHYLFLSAAGEEWSQLVRSYFEIYLEMMNLPPQVVDFILPLGIIRQVLRIRKVYNIPYALIGAERWRKTLVAYGASPQDLLSAWPR